MKTKLWDRWRFKANLEDYRPVEWPPPGPYWCSGEGDTYAVIVAYFPAGSSSKDILHYWPEAVGLDRMQQGTSLVFSDRFAKPDWWKDTSV